MKRPAGVKGAVNVRRTLDVCIGNVGTRLGELVYVKQGARENTAFAYDPAWLARDGRFTISPDLELTPAYQRRRAPTPQDSVFHHALADTAPDAWGRRVIARDHAKRRVAESLPPLTELDYLLAVDDFSRLGALRLRDGNGNYLRATADGRRNTPPLVDLQMMYDASRAVENGFWRLAPAFDINPFPDKVNESKTWLSEEDGPITAVSDLMARAAYFSLGPGQAQAVLAQVVAAVSEWRVVASSAQVGLTLDEAEDFAPAFEHEQIVAARALLK